jgi:dihydrofolate reductase
MARKVARKSTGSAPKPVCGRARPHAPKPGKRPLVRAALAVSLDGYIADKRGGVEWLNPFFSPEMDFAGFMASIGATVMGRKTFDVAMKIGMPPGSSDQTSVVLSRRKLGSAPQGFIQFAGDLRKLVEQLRRDLDKTGKDVWLMGGGKTIDAFRAAALIDRFELSVILVLLGEGILLFPHHKRGIEGLQLTRTRAFKNGVVELWYERG